MADAASLRATVWGPLLIGALVALTGAAPTETLSGKIKTIDRSAGVVVLGLMSSDLDRTLKMSRETVVAGVSGSDDATALAIGQVVTASVETETEAVRKLTVVLAPAQPVVPSPMGEPRITHRALKPGSSALSTSTARSGSNQAYGLTVTPVKSVDAVLTYELTYPDVRATEWVVLAPKAPELPSQMNVYSDLIPGGSPTWDLSPSHRPLLVSRFAVTPRDHSLSQKVSARAEYRLTLLARHLYRRQAGDSIVDAIPLGIEERRRALARGGAFELDAPEFRRWLSAERLAMSLNESEIDFARRIFLAIRRSFTYEYREGMDRRLSRVCAAGRSDCGGLAILFAAALRTQGIPARILVGRWARSAEPGERLGGSAYHQWHVKAEFYAEGVGWIPADPAASLVYDHSPEGLRDFGHDSGDFLTLHVDADLVLDSIHFGPQPTPFLNGGLGVWVVGTGSLANPRVRQDWQVRELRASSRPGPVADSLRSTLAPR